MALRKLSTGSGASLLIDGRRAMTSYGLLSATWHQIRVSGKTCWTFVQLQQADGSIGHCEASLSGDEAAVIAAAERLSSSILQASTS